MTRLHLVIDFGSLESQRCLAHVGSLSVMFALITASLIRVTDEKTRMCVQKH